MVEVEERVSLIQQIGLFQNVDPSELESIAQQMTENTFNDGEVVFLEGDAGDRLYLILSGTMHVYVERNSPICCIRETLSFSCTIDFSWIPELGDQSQPWL